MKCYNCMTETEDKICPHCGSELNPKPLKDKQLPPGTILKDRYYIGYACEETTIFTAYNAWDSLKDKRVIINEYMPLNLSKREGIEIKPRTDGESKQIFENGLDCIRKETEDLKLLHNVDVIGGFEANGTYYTVRKYLNGLSVAKLMNGDYELNKDYARRVLILLLRTINSISKLGIIHGNIKPETVFFNKDTSVTIADFSFCGYLANHIEVNHNDGYTPLELYTIGGKAGVSADVYSTAAVFYRLLTGETPPAATDRARLENLVAPSILGIDIKQHIENALLNALNIMPENRTKTVKDFHAELKDVKTPRRWERFSTPTKKKITIKKKDLCFRVGVYGIVLVMLIAFGIMVSEYRTIKKQTENEAPLEISTESIEDRLNEPTVSVKEPEIETTTKRKYFTDADKIDNTPPNKPQSSSNSNSVGRVRDTVVSGSANR